MDNVKIEEIWQQHATLLDDSRKLNAALLKEVKVDQARSTLKSLLFLPVSTLIFFMVTGFYGMYFTFIHWESWYLAFSGIVIAIASLLYTIASVKQLRELLSIDYDAPVLTLQRDISKIKSSFVNNLRIAAWILPFSPFIGIFFVKTLFDFDLTALPNYNLLTTLGVIAIILEIATLFILRALQPENINKKWVTWLLKGSGSQVDEALRFLDQIEAFEEDRPQTSRKV